MLEAYCPNCEKEVIIENDNEISCPNCFETDLEIISDVKQIENSIDDNVKILGLELIYQKSLEKISIPKSKVILGRENLGREIFNKIKDNNNFVISRVHCSIEFNEDLNKFMIKDLNSLNGTFVNDKKCFELTVIEKDSIIKIGEEIFVVNYISSNETNELNTTINNSLEQKIIEKKEKFYCPDCSKEYNEDGYCTACEVKLKKI